MTMENAAPSMPLETPLLELHRSAGAEIGGYFGTRLPARFGNFESEYEVIRNSVALADTNFRSLFSFSGVDRQRYLNAILTSNVRDLQPGQGTVGLLLTPQGHILAEVETLLLNDRILAISHAIVSPRTFATLDKFIIMDDVTLEDVTASTGTLDLIGPRTTEMMSDFADIDLASMQESSHGEASLGSIPFRVVRHTFAGHPAATLMVARDRLGPLWQELEERVRSLGGVPAGMEAVNSVRLESGTAWFGQDYDDKNIPHEAGLETSHISYVKGCYTGQEIVERVRSRGHVNRRLTGLQFPDGASPAPGSKLAASGAEAGHVTSTGFSPMLGHPIGLGYVRREHSAPGTILDATGVKTEVILLSLPSPKTAT